MKTALVLGGTGTIGNQLCKRLKQEGFWVRCVDRKKSEFSETECDELILGDLRDSKFVSQVMLAPKQHSLNDKESSFDEVFMLACQMGGALYVFDGNSDAEIIYDSALMNLNVCDAASRFNVKKIFFSSSACCYSEKHQLTAKANSLKEDTAWDGKPDSVYGIEKLISEQLYDAYRRNRGLNIRIARFHNIFSTEAVFDGGREKAPSAICRKIAAAKEGDTIEIIGDGEQVRSFLFVDEALDGVRRLMDSDYVYPLNIGSDEPISINNLVKMVIEISGKKNIFIKHIDGPQGVRGRNSDNELIFETLGWRPLKPLREGILVLYNWINKQVNS